MKSVSRMRSMAKSRTGKLRIYLCIGGWHTFCFGALIIIRCHIWHSGPRWCPSWWMGTCAFAPPACLSIVCSAILARMAAVCVIFANHHWVYFDCGLPFVIPGTLNTLHLLFSDFRVRFLEYLLRFLYCGLWKPSFGNFPHIQGMTHVRLFKLYPTSMSCHSSWHVETLQETVATSKVRSTYYLNHIWLLTLL
jgi:hypothetical protein